MNYINKGKRDILIIPKFNNVNKIQIIREKYDELFDNLEEYVNKQGCTLGEDVDRLQKLIFNSVLLPSWCSYR